jgi:hypothetical protein
MAQKKNLKGIPSSGSVYGDRRDRDDRDRDDRDRDDRDRDDDRWEDQDGPGRNGRGHAYGHYSKAEKERRKAYDKEQKRMQKGDMCLDANRDAICDVAQRDRNVYGSTRYPSTGTRYPATLPDMVGAVFGARGQRTAETTRWLGDRPLTVRTERARNGRVAQASWSEGNSLVQRWFDRDLDGRADLVQVYRAGQLLHSVSR